MSFLRLLGFGQKKIRIKTISVHQAHKGVISGSYWLVDVRSAEEWTDTGRPQGSKGITLQDPAFVTKIAHLLGNDKTAAIAMSCKSGGRSLQGSNKLLDAGFTNISNVEGGFLEWEKQGLPIDRPPFNDVS